MLVVAFVNRKGGVGKTQLAVNVALALHVAKRRVCLIDTDLAQGTAQRWAERAKQRDEHAPPVIPIGAFDLAPKLRQLRAEGVEAVIVDTAAQLGDAAGAAMLCADLACFPVVPGGESLAALSDALQLLAAAREARPGIQGGLIFNQATHTTVARLTFEECQAIAARHNLPVLGTVAERIAFRDAWLRGQGAVTYDPQGPAAADIRGLVRAMRRAVEPQKARRAAA